MFMKYDSSENCCKFLNLVMKEKERKFTLSQVSDKKKNKQTEASDSLKELLLGLLLFMVQFQVLLLSFPSECSNFSMEKLKFYLKSIDIT